MIEGGRNRASDSGFIREHLTGVAVLLFIHLVVKEGPLFAGMMTYVLPVVVLAWRSFDGEAISPRQLERTGASNSTTC